MFETSSYYGGSEVTIGSGRKKRSEPLVQALPSVKGQVVLEGQSGVGKTSFILKLATKSRNPVVLLRATECGEGVITAIQRKLHGLAKDAKFLQTLIHAGAIDVLIDGLNDASPEARVQINLFTEEQFKGNIILTTQPMNWEPPPTAQIFELQPLRPEQIEDFLKRQWQAIAHEAIITEAEYQKRGSEYLSMLSSNPSALEILCNPMELRLAAEILAEDKKPDIYALIEQRFRQMYADFKKRNHREFPKKQFAERVYEWRKSEEMYLNIAGFEAEANSLAKHKLMLRRREFWQSKNGKEVVQWLFRHDRIMEHALVPAFLKDIKRRYDHDEDERFTGVYELLAKILEISEAKKLHKFLVEKAAKTKRNELVNRYTLALMSREKRDVIV